MHPGLFYTLSYVELCRMTSMVTQRYYVIDYVLVYSAPKYKCGRDTEECCVGEVLFGLRG